MISHHKIISQSYHHHHHLCTPYSPLRYMRTCNDKRWPTMILRYDESLMSYLLPILSSVTVVSMSIAMTIYSDGICSTRKPTNSSSRTHTHIFTPQCFVVDVVPFSIQYLQNLHIVRPCIHSYMKYCIQFPNHLGNVLLSFIVSIGDSARLGSARFPPAKHNQNEIQRSCKCTVNIRLVISLIVLNTKEYNGLFGKFCVGRWFYRGHLESLSLILQHVDYMQFF